MALTTNDTAAGLTPAQDGHAPAPRRFNFFSMSLIFPAVVESLRKLAPSAQIKNPVMFVVYVGSILTTLLWIMALRGQAEAPAGFILGVALWLWFTVLFANFAEALAEGRGKQQAATLRGLRTTLTAHLLRDFKQADIGHAQPDDWRLRAIARASGDLRKDDVVLVEAGDTVPGDGLVLAGVASVDESAITGESAPVIREAGGDFSSVTGGTRVLSDWLFVRIAADPGESFLDRMISMVEGAKRQKTPNELALTILLVGLTVVFLLVTVTLLPFAQYAVLVGKAGVVVSVTALVALLVCLIPTTIGGLLSAIGVAGMSRMMQANVMAMSGRAVEAAGDVDVLLLDKTGTITFGNRQASAFMPAPGVSQRELAEAARLASQADETPEGRSIVVLAEKTLGLAPAAAAATAQTRTGGAVAESGTALAAIPEVIPFTAQTRMSGVDIGGRQLRKGAVEAVRQWLAEHGVTMDSAVTRAADDVARRGSTPLAVAEGGRVLGVVELKDIVKPAIKERFGELRRMGIKTVMITGDNKLTAAAIAAEAGVDDYLAEATPEAKLKLIRTYQAEGRLVAMTGDGTNDAPALAQADVAVAMNSGTQAAKEAGNMVDLDSNPTKLIEIVEIGKQMLMTRGALTTFSVANDVAKYFAIIPAAFASVYPQLGVLNVMGLATPASAIMSAVIFNALIIVVLIPLALKGVRYRPLGAATLLRRNLLIYGLGGLLVPFAGIKAIDMVLAALGLA
ncbi:potassium-transporting ATPase subunit KdpB [Bordetella sp. N]|uniref:potassium-transporting ATPase subunit KdpB n=1 Tax=Bordetella sp. N TaxID=1746199 RepID=UPI00070C87B1|nr:potassium-transporting ATPase subunit KdpB [Bordetella sp. N]ALM86529.1 potassium-transporting ATPase subunit B [Bordetella sp. N]